MTALIDSASGLMTAWGPSLVLKATITLLLALLAVRLARHSRASVRHLWLTAGFAVLLALPFASALIPAVRVEVTPVSPVLARYIAPPTAIEPLPVFTVAPLRPSPAPPAPLWTPADMVAALWLGGLLASALPVVIGVVQVRRFRRNGLPWRNGQKLVSAVAREAGLRRPIDVALHGSISAPATCGIRRHAILFPIDADSWSDEDIVRAAAHEVEHVRRADCVVTAVTRMICAVYWFHPLVWIAWRRLGLEAERACDDAVLRRAEATGYADQLVTLAGRLPGNARHPLLAMANRSDLVRRVAAVLDQRQARGRAGLTVGAAIAVVTCLLIAVVSPLRAVTAAPPEDASAPRTLEPGPADTVSSRHLALPASGTIESRPPASTVAASRATAQAPAVAQQNAADAAQPAFEVASIRQNTSISQAPTTRVEGGRYLASNVPLQQLISDAYRMPVVGGPEWIRDPPGPRKSGEVRFDVVATIPPGTPPARVPLLLRTLLAQRFKLAVHTETREQPAYTLVHAREDKRLGAQLTRSTQQCQVEIEAGPLRAPVTRVTEDGKPVCSMMQGPAAIRGGGLTMRFLANALGVYAGRIVVYRTGLEGPFDFSLTYAPAGRGGTPPPPSDERPSIFVAIQEQLGLKLEPAVEPVEVLVIDQAQLPTEN